MAKTKTARAARPATGPPLDRWATLNDFVDCQQGPLTGETGSPSAAVVWFTLFRLASGTTGLVRGASLSKLARLTGLARTTVRRAVGALLKSGFLRIHDWSGDVKVYLLDHVLKEVDDRESETRPLANGQPVGGSR